MSGIIEAFDSSTGSGRGPTRTHFTYGDVKKLRKLINTKLAQDASDGGDARIIGYFENRPAHPLRARVHVCAARRRYSWNEIEHGKRLAVEPAALLAEKNRPRRCPTNGHGRDHKKQAKPGPSEQMLRPHR